MSRRTLSGPTHVDDKARSLLRFAEEMSNVGILAEWRNSGR